MGGGGDDWVARVKGVRGARGQFPDRDAKRRQGRPWVHAVAARGQVGTGSGRGGTLPSVCDGLTAVLCTRLHAEIILHVNGDGKSKLKTKTLSKCAAEASFLQEKRGALVLAMWGDEPHLQGGPNRMRRAPWPRGAQSVPGLSGGPRGLEQTPQPPSWERGLITHCSAKWFLPGDLTRGLLSSDTGAPGPARPHRSSR